ncbi:hypothetical protein [Gilvimarinus agarilyticus]|uniref:hypothetical protein n=1 Tax=Gilvimarinus agarilyticus TaxID=679259 RepID=UPI0012F9AF86|nr:hypothetical protein [Gilvimarinus agarilyticus]
MKVSVDDMSVGIQRCNRKKTFFPNDFDSAEDAMSRGHTLNGRNSIDIRYLRREGLLRPGAVGTLRWSIGGRECGSVSYKIDDKQILVSYRYNHPDKGWVARILPIMFEATSCHYGGERLWFSCPSCNRRVGILFDCGSLFICRHCCRLPYVTQNENQAYRLIRKKHKLGQRIFADYHRGSGSIKTKGMHWKTFERLHRQYQNLEQCWLQSLDDFLQKHKWLD